MKDQENFINIASVDQLNTLKDVSILDIYLGEHNIIEPHYHPDMYELIYCAAGKATISMMDPQEKKFDHFTIESGMIVNIPSGWWHYILSYAEKTHLLGIFDANKPKTVFGSDILTATPADVMAYTYTLNEKEWKDVTAAIKPSTVIGPSSKK